MTPATKVPGRIAMRKTDFGVVLLMLMPTVSWAQRFEESDLDREMERFFITCTIKIKLGEVEKTNAKIGLAPFMIFERQYFANPSTYTYVVDDDGGRHADFSTIQDALDASADGNRIYVCPGRYEERIKISSDVELVSLQGADATIIDASSQDSGTVVRITASARVEGFTITGASMEDVCYYGGGIKIVGQTGQSHNYPVIKHNKILDNHACIAGGIYLSGFARNDGDVVNNTAVIRNNVIAGNRAERSNAGGLMIDADRSVESQIYNNIFASNSTLLGSGGIEVTGLIPSSDDIRNNILYDNWGTLSSIYTFAGGTVEYNNSWANNSNWSGGIGNINVPPNFVDSDDYRLQSTSACSDPGDPDPRFDDFDGSQNDMGAYGGAG